MSGEYIDTEKHILYALIALCAMIIVCVKFNLSTQPTPINLDLVCPACKANLELIEVTK